MSRIGRKSIIIPADCQVNIEERKINVKGPRGELDFPIDRNIRITQEDNTLKVTRKTEDKKTRAMHGLTRAIVQNMVTGVVSGFEKKLEVKGVGYKVHADGNKLNLTLGYSHPSIFQAPDDISVKVEKNIITISGIDKALVGEIAARIRKLRKPDAYKGKGIRYLGELIKLKPGKMAKSAAGGAA